MIHVLILMKVINELNVERICLQKEISPMKVMTTDILLVNLWEHILPEQLLHYLTIW